MKLEKSTFVEASPEEVFTAVNDVERVVTCVPGAALDGRDGDAYQGNVKVKVGPISAAYSGTVRFLDVDADQHTLRVQARGSEAGGSGDAEAEVTLGVTEREGGSVLSIEADLLIRGKIAQFGKAAIGTVSDRLLQQFADNLSRMLREGSGAEPAAAASASAAGQVPAQAGPAAATAAAAPAPAGEELDGLGLLVGPRTKKVLPYVGAFAVGVLQGLLIGKLAAQSKQIALLKEARRG
ncbi:SRPBCC family protein [Nocardiopsis xinjiangensis]|uniref:SRPBCC family protein n=1 Tax=Nocardiopsis xinjiangensis TaxID=124285 RepID=UPI00034A1933|nr:SRPBCC family protein [Nocardiopsis xinjiangensis]